MDADRPSTAKEHAYPFGMTRAEIGLAIDGLAKTVDAEHPLLWRLKALYALSKDLEPVAADRLPDPAASYMLFDRETGNAVGSYTDADEARAALREAVEAAGPSAADLLVLIPFDVEGMPCGDSVTFADIPPVSAAVSPAEPPATTTEGGTQ